MSKNRGGPIIRKNVERVTALPLPWVVGFNLRSMRKAQKVSQEKLAAIARCSQPTLSKTERGEVAIPAENLFRISLFLEKSMEAFFSEVVFDQEEFDKYARKKGRKRRK